MRRLHEHAAKGYTVSTRPPVLGHGPFTSVTAFAPGRVNLIGEHTDYNAGLALPFAIEQGVTVRATASGDRTVHAIAHDLQAQDAFGLERPRPVHGWRAFVRGAVAELASAGIALAGARLEIDGTVPRGGGLASSAALELAVCMALLAVAGAPAPEPAPLALARICSRVENDWVGAHTGLLDQLASLCGRTGEAVLIDFETLTVTSVAIDLHGHRLVVLDSGERHSHGSDPATEYNARREECAEAAARLGLPSLRAASWEMTGGLPEPLRRRARHVVAENERVRATVQALADGDLARVGSLLDESHGSLRDLFEVSTAAVEQARRALLESGALGARLIGGGFGGYVLGLMPAQASLPAGARVVAPAAGARLLDASSAAQDTVRNAG